MTDALELFASRFTPPVHGAGGAAGSAPQLCIPSLTGSADAFLALAMATGAVGAAPETAERKPRIVLAVTPGLPDADHFCDRQGQ